MRTKEVKDWLDGLVHAEGDNPIDVEIAKHVMRVWELVDEISRGRQQGYNGSERSLDRLIGYFGEYHTQLGILHARARASQRQLLQREAEGRAGRQAT